MFMIGPSNKCIHVALKRFLLSFSREMSGVLIMITWIGISRFTNIGRFVIATIFENNVENCRLSLWNS